jgi:hypothetical protein
MANITKMAGGYFGGRSLVQQTGTKGGARHVFVKFDDIKDDLVFPTFGGQVMNPFPGAAKLFAGDLMEFRTETDGLKGKVWILKTYEVVSASGTTVNIVRDGYHHIPFVSDVLTVAPETIGGTGAAMTVVAVTKTKVDTQDVWALTLSAAPTTAPAKGDILVECDSTGKMLVKNINACAAWDYDFMWSQAADPTDEDEFEAARYFLTPTLRGTIYESRMSPMPKCVKDLNISNINGWFRFDALNKPNV